jgi:hypothetical protein
MAQWRSRSVEWESGLVSSVGVNLRCFNDGSLVRVRNDQEQLQWEVCLWSGKPQAVRCGRDLLADPRVGGLSDSHIC